MWGSGFIGLRLLDLITNCKQIVGFTPLPLYPPADKTLGVWVDPEPVWTMWGREHVLCTMENYSYLVALLIKDRALEYATFEV
jgi:hypothetical protein